MTARTRRGRPSPATLVALLRPAALRPAFVLAVLRREISEIARNRWLLLSIGLPPVFLVGFPLILGVLMTEEPMPPELLAAIAAQRPEWTSFTPEEIAAAFGLQQFLPYFLLMPAYVPLAIATYSIIGEKQTRSLEAVLATPIRTTELLAGKVVAALVPGVLAGWLSYAVFVGLARILYGPNLLSVVSDSSWTAGALVLGPAIGLASTLSGVLVSSRVNDPRVAQQVGGVVVIPIVAVSLLQATGTFLVDATGYLVAAAVIGLLSLVGLRFGAWLFDREAILTRWR